MDDSIKNFLSQIIMERMELTSSLKEISFILQMKPNLNMNKEIDKILDRLDYLEKIENEIRKRM